MGRKNSYVSFRRTPLTWKYALGGVRRCGRTVEPPSSSAMGAITALRRRTSRRLRPGGGRRVLGLAQPRVKPGSSKRSSS
jgi:hypothetical protein